MGGSAIEPPCPGPGGSTGNIARVFCIHCRSAAWAYYCGGMLSGALRGSAPLFGPAKLTGFGTGFGSRAGTRAVGWSPARQEEERAFAQTEK
jgi:hypothetical protein